MLVTTKEMFKLAQEKHFAIPAPDYYDSNSIKNFVKVAEKLKQPVILSFAEGFSTFMDLEEAYYIGKYFAEKATVPVALHIDHGMSPDFIKKAIDLGFTSVMIDASSESLEVNIARTKEIVDYAHPRGVVVEAEIGHVGAENPDGPHELSKSQYTDVEEAKKFVEATNVDSLAVSIGTVHGKYMGTPKINFERLEELKNALDVPLVLHGGSSTGDENLNRCARGGICKVNIFTDFSNAAVKAVYEDKIDFFPNLIQKSDKAVQDVVEHYYHVFECDK